MNRALVLDEKKYSRLLAKTGPRVIESEQEHKRLLAQVRELMERDEEKLSTEEARLLDLLVGLIEQYEEKHHVARSAKPHQVLAHLMEARRLTHKDVWRVLGSKGVASEVLNGKRSISKAQAKRLGAFFHVAADLFI
jgi:HTH-type transcriptional regulator / antitoxin HigA